MTIYKLIFLLLVYVPVSFADLYIIGDPELSISSINNTEITDLFLKRHASLDDGVTIIPVNHPANSIERSDFEKYVLNQTQREIKSYWLKLRFKGIRPPLVQDSDKAILLFVQRVSGAISYIQSEIKPEGVKILMTIKQ